MNKRLITVFLKWPEPGKVKTRLAGRLGKAAAAQIYRRLVRAVGRVLREREGADLCIFYTPAACEESLRAWLEPEVFPPAPDVFWRAQPEGDLGVRQAAAVTDAFARGYEAVALVGTDCVALRLAHFTQAWEALEAGATWVVGPATDGGYWLVATRTADTAFFENVRWSTSETLRDCLENIPRSACRQLEVLADVDEYDDWLSIKDQIETSHARP